MAAAAVARDEEGLARDWVAATGEEGAGFLVTAEEGGVRGWAAGGAEGEGV